MGFETGLELWALQLRPASAAILKKTREEEG